MKINDCHNTIADWSMGPNNPTNLNECSIRKFRIILFSRQIFFALDSNLSIKCFMYEIVRDITHREIYLCICHGYIRTFIYIDMHIHMFLIYVYVLPLLSIRCLWSLIEPSSKSRSSPALQNRSFIAIPGTQGGYTSALSHRLQLRVIGKLLAALPIHNGNGQAR